MTVRPVDLNGMIQRMDDVGVIKKHEDSKPLLDQQNIQVQVNKREDNLSHTIVNADGTSNLKNDSDARNGSRGSYSGNFSKKKKKKQDKVIKKEETGRFDIKI